MENFKEKEVLDILNRLSVEYIYHEHEPIFTVEEGRELHKNFRGINTKTLLLRDKKKENYVLLAMHGDKRLDLKSIESKFGYSRLSFAKADELEQILNVSPGSVSPLALIYDNSFTVDIIFDKDVREADYVSFHPNNNSISLDIQKEGFRKFIDWLGRKVKLVEL